MDRLEAMSMLLTVVAEGSFSAASRTLGVPVATLSRKVTDLEIRLGTRLLTRTTRKLSLTDTGEAYITAARRILDAVEEAEREAAGEFTMPKGELVITAPILFGRLHVLPIVGDFLALYPEIQVRLTLSDRNLHLVDDHVDMAVRLGPLPDSQMKSTKVGTMRTVIVASPSLLAAHGTPETPADLAAFPAIGFEAPTPVAAWRFRAENGDAIEIAPDMRLRVSTAEAVRDAATGDIGLARLFHYQVADAVDAGALRIILDAYESEPAPIHLLHAARGQLPLKMRRFLDFAAPLLRQRLKRFG
ncbi:LysR family transcriptional regulator [Acuticoccus sp. M5D2P5]|uniref:LysR family transcriptional regulator n=1 Tax=Acuticoccus kalidii TaxID=2910977 RepID=UPI001F370D56|nr:LysR family transcriptional regulator [Acuticoccus kalidii]MCF3932444.1 LysR family transcriptional regulator [Acuticoccus kalidii]